MADSESIFNEEEVKKPAKEVPIVHDDGSFVHATGDKYDGGFEARKKDKVIKMHGNGVYTTAEGDVYEGYWDSDRLGVANEVTISYNDGSKYAGNLKDWCYQGPGKYTYPDESFIQGEFVENCPASRLTLLDPNGHKWLGKADVGFGWFEPVNHFYEMIETKKESPKDSGSPSKRTKTKQGKTTK